MTTKPKTGDHMIRSFPDKQYALARSRARARGVNLGPYLGSLVALHDTLVGHAAGGDEWAESALRASGLERVHEGRTN